MSYQVINPTSDYYKRRQSWVAYHFIYRILRDVVSSVNKNQISS